MVSNDIFSNDPRARDFEELSCPNEVMERYNSVRGKRSQEERRLRDQLNYWITMGIDLLLHKNKKKSPKGSDYETNISKDIGDEEEFLLKQDFEKDYSPSHDISCSSQSKTISSGFVGNSKCDDVITIKTDDEGESSFEEDLKLLKREFEMICSSSHDCESSSQLNRISSGTSGNTKCDDIVAEKTDDKEESSLEEEIKMVYSSLHDKKTSSQQKIASSDVDGNIKLSSNNNSAEENL